MKQFSTARNTQRDSQNYIEKRRGRRKIELTKRRGGVKGERAIKPVINSLKCSPQPRTPREIHRVKQRREGGGRR